MTVTATATESAPAPDVRDNKMPSAIWFIVSNEFAERFCFYGINSILTVYLVQNLSFTDSAASSWQSLFKSGAYFFPMIGAVISDVFWGKYRTILVFSLVYAIGCAMLALLGHATAALGASLLLVALGTGGIKPCVATNVGDQFTSKNQHLVERAFSMFYLAINSGSAISIFLCPILLTPLDKRPTEGFVGWLGQHLPSGAEWAFGIPSLMMGAATIVFWLGRAKYAAVPPAGKKWLDDALSADGLKLLGRLAVIYFFVALFWMLWDQSNGNTWTLQAQSVLVDKNLGFGFTVLPAQLQVVNGLFILALTPIFSFVVYPVIGRFTKVTPLRKIGAGLFVAALSFVIVAHVENEIQAGRTVSAWWQIFAYVVLTMAEVLVSITALEFSYKQAPLRMKSFIMALFYLSISLGNLLIAGVNSAIIKPVHPVSAEVGEVTWLTVSADDHFEVNQKIDFTGPTGLTQRKADGTTKDVQGTYVVAEVQGARLRLIDAIDRKPVVSAGTFALKDDAKVTTSYLVGSMYFYFFAGIVCVMGLGFVVFALRYREQNHMRDEAPAAAA